ncbi:MAG: sulfatase-like hydrolase/transferase [Opitutaceae bacterium]|nr:sulfatase-like hydrolase/transferase [Opitutaceae bacterium]
MRCTWFIGLALASLSPSAIAAGNPSASVTRPNIVFIFADDWGWGDLSCHGHPWLKTPNIDRLANEGIGFQQFNVLNPVCSPSRTAAMTGHFPSRYSVHQHFAAPAQNLERNMPDWLDSKAPTVARFLKQAGYRTGHFGKWHLTSRNIHGAPTPAAYGFDEYAVFNGGADMPSAHLHDTPVNAVKFILASKARPFFVNVWLHESHLPHVPTKAAMEKWSHLDEQKRVYAAVITDGDNAVGRVLDSLETAGVAQNTIVIFSSDNGPESTAATPQQNMRDEDAGVTGYGGYYSVGSTGGLRGRKRSLFEGGVRVPFIVRWPGHVPAGLKNDSTVFTAVDLLPTLCAAAGVTLPAEYHGDGENLLAALDGRPAIRTRPIFWKWTGRNAEPDWWPRLAVRDGEWKLALTDDAKRVELHPLNADRAESADVAREHPEIVARLTRLALDWNATLPAKPDPSCISTADRAGAATSPRNRGKTGETRAQPATKATPDRAQAFQRMDTNHDGSLTLEEYKAGLKGAANLEQRFKNFDRNSDGRLSREEFVNPSGK